MKVSRIEIKTFTAMVFMFLDQLSSDEERTKHKEMTAKKFII